MAKRTRGTDEEEKADNITVADLLLLLSCGAAAKTRKMSEAMSSRQATVSTSERTFECKTCGRRFASFQALGGHCTTHKRSRGREVVHAPERRRIHGCAVCGAAFSTGQALGGHMGHHKDSDGERSSDGTKILLLDLNMPPPPKDELKPQYLLFGLPLLELRRQDPSVHFH